MSEVQCLSPEVVDAVISEYMTNWRSGNDEQIERDIMEEIRLILRATRKPSCYRTFAADMYKAIARFNQEDIETVFDIVFRFRWETRQALYQNGQLESLFADKSGSNQQVSA